MKPFKYRNPRVAPPEYTNGQSVLRVGEKEVLSGQVQGMKASDLEERWARSHEKYEMPFEFRVRLTSPMLGAVRLTHTFANIKGEIELDTLGGRDRTVPVFIDGSISHFFTPYQAIEDKEKEDAVNEFGRMFGWAVAVRVPYWKLLDQDMTDRTFREVYRL